MQVVIFDLDGTLLDVREGFYWQFQELVLLYDGVPVSKEAINAAAHGTTEQIVRALVSNTEVPLQEILLTHRNLRLQAYDRFLKLYTGVDAVLTHLSRNGVQIAAFTSGNALSVGCLDRTQIRHHFRAIISAEHVQNFKPHPEGLLMLMDTLGVKADNTTMIGDTAADILAGKNAGVRNTIGVLHGFGKKIDLHEAGADHVVLDIPSILNVIR